MLDTHLRSRKVPPKVSVSHPLRRNRSLPVLLELAKVMVPSMDEIRRIVETYLTEAERNFAVVHALATPVPPGTVLKFPGATIRTPWEAIVAFVDQEPEANWSHRCRYVLIN